jgi:hypothetical protein
MRIKKKKLKKKFQNGCFSKWPFFKISNSQKKFVKFSWICPWVSRIDWCEGHWCSSTYMVVRLSDVSSKTGKKCIFCVFRLFLHLRWAASRPFRLNYINALGINQSYLPKDQSMNFSQKKIENWRFWKMAILKNGHFFFASSPWKSAKATWVSRMGRNFDDYSGLQQKSKCA